MGKSLDYDDRAWQLINPTFRYSHDLTQIPKSGIGWFLFAYFYRYWCVEIVKQLALVIQQSGASEIYSNGRLIYQFWHIEYQS